MYWISVSDIDGQPDMFPATMKDHLVGEELIADYLLYWLNKNGHWR